MKLTNIMKNHGWSSYELDKPSNKLKVYQKNDYLVGVQKIGNVFRLDVHHCLNLGGMILPSQRIINNEIIRRDALESTLDHILPQL